MNWDDAATFHPTIATANLGRDIARQARAEERKSLAPISSFPSSPASRAQWHARAPSPDRTGSVGVSQRRRPSRVERSPVPGRHTALATSTTASSANREGRRRGQRGPQWSATRSALRRELEGRDTITLPIVTKRIHRRAHQKWTWWTKITAACATFHGVSPAAKQGRRVMPDLPLIHPLPGHIWPANARNRFTSKKF